MQPVRSVAVPDSCQAALPPFPSVLHSSQTMEMTIDRGDYCEGSLLFWTEHHSGQFSKGYARMCRIQRWFSSGLWFDWDHISDGAKDVYRAWCKRESVDCEYDQLRYRIEEHYDLNDPCVEYFVDRYNNDPEALRNYYHSDFVNCDMCYTRDLLRFYDDNWESVHHWFDEMCGSYGYTSTLEALEGETIDSPDDMKTAMVNHAMTYLARQILDAISSDR